MRRPSLPLPATSTEYPAVTSARVMKSRILGSSSTTRMREPAWLCAGTAVVMKRLANHLTLAGLCPRRSALPGCALAGLPCQAVPSPVSLARPLGADGARAPGGWLSGENPPRQPRRQLATRKPLHDCYLQGIPWAYDIPWEYPAGNSHAMVCGLPVDGGAGAVDSHQKATPRVREPHRPPGAGRGKLVRAQPGKADRRGHNPARQTGEGTTRQVLDDWRGAS